MEHSENPPSSPGSPLPPSTSTPSPSTQPSTPDQPTLGNTQSGPTPVEESPETPSTHAPPRARPSGHPPKLIATPSVLLDTSLEDLHVRLHSPAGHSSPLISIDPLGSPTSPSPSPRSGHDSSPYHVSSTSSLLQALTADEPTSPTAVLRSKLPYTPTPIPPPVFPLDHTAQNAGKLVFGATRHVKVKNGDNIHKGETILRAEPSHKVLHHALLPTHCSGCFLSPHQKAKKSKKKVETVFPEFLQCSKCKCVVYCSMKCYVKDWRVHQFECKALTKDITIARADIRLFARAIFARTYLPLTERNKFWVNPTSIPIQPELSELAGYVVNYLRLVHPEDTDLDERYGFGSTNTLMFFLRTLQCEMFPVRDGHDFTIGICLCRTANKFSHSCRPNAFFAFPQGLDVDMPLHIVAIDDQFGGDELYISYSDLEIPCHEREDILARQGFLHICEWCEFDMNEGDVRFCLKHASCQEEGIFPLSRILSTDEDVKCTECDVRLSLGELPHREAMGTMMQYYDKEEIDLWTFARLPTMDRAEIAMLTEQILNLSVHVPDTLYPLPHLHLRLAKLLMFLPEPTVEDIEKAIEELETAHSAYMEIHFEEPRLLTLAILFHMMVCHAFLIERFLRASGTVRQGPRTSSQGDAARGSPSSSPTSEAPMLRPRRSRSPVPPHRVQAPNGSWYTRPAMVLTVGSPVNPRVSVHVRLARDIVSSARSEAEELLGLGVNCQLSRDIDKISKKLDGYAWQAGMD